MTEAQKAVRALREARGKRDGLRKELRELAGDPESKAEDRSAKESELADAMDKVTDLEARCRQLELSGTGEEREERETVDESPEDRERRELLGKARLGSALRACIDGKPFAGAELELRSAFGLTGDHEVPHELFEPIGGVRDREGESGDRAATPAPGTTAVAEAPAQPFIYREGVAGFLGVDMPQVGPGVAAWPVLTTGAPAGPKAKGDDADETAAAFTVSTSTPRRVTGSFRVRVEDMAVFPQLEDALRRDIPQSLANAVDDQILTGDGSAPNITGLLGRLTDPAAAGAKTTAPGYVSALAGALDGRHGYGLRDLRAIVGKGTYATMAGTFFDSTAESVASWLDRATGGVRMSDRIPAVNANVQPAVVRVGMRPMVAVAGVWGGVQLIRDPFSSAAAGEIVVTALQLISDVHVLHSGAFAELSFYP